MRRMGGLNFFHLSFVQPKNWPDVVKMYTLYVAQFHLSFSFFFLRMFWVVTHELFTKFL